MKNLTKKNHIMMFAESDAPLEQIEGTLYRKMIAKYGEWVNPIFPMEKMTLDKEWATLVKANFDARVIDRVPIPRNHTDDVDANTGEVKELSVEDDGLYAVLDIRDWKTTDDINGGLIFDVSISFDWNYIDTAEGKEHGPVLLHVALVNNPYLHGMSGFEKTPEQLEKEQVEEDMWGYDIQALTDFSKKHKKSAIMLSESKAKELRDMLVTIKNDRDFPVTISVKDEDGEAVEKTLAAGEEVQVPQDQSEEILKVIADAEKPADDGDQETEEEKAAREAKEAEEAEAAKKAEEEEAARKAKEAEEDANLTDEEKQAKAEKAELADLRAKNAKLELSQKYDTLLKAGKITPAQKEKFMALSEVHQTKVSLSEGKTVNLSEMVIDILQAGPQVVKFSEEGTQETEEEKAAREKREAEEAAAAASKKPSETLSDQEKAGMEAVGADPKRMDELAGKYPAMAAALNNNQPTEEK